MQRARQIADVADTDTDESLKAAFEDLALSWSADNSPVVAHQADRTPRVSPDHRARTIRAPTDAAGP